MAPDAFWRQTPRLFSIVITARGRTVERERYDRAWLARTTAVLMRWQKGPFPALEQLAGVQTKAPVQTTAQMKSVFAAMRVRAGED